MRFISAIVAALLVATPLAAQGEQDQKRKLYALMNAAPEYCPDIETRWFVQGSIGYEFDAEDVAEWKRLEAAEQEWFSLFQQIGHRTVACEAIMQEYGPGGTIELFQWE